MYTVSRVIVGFGNQETEDIWAGDDTKAARSVLPRDLWPNACLLLDQLDAATVIGDMALPPSNRLHKLKGKLKGHWSVSINMKYRIVFEFESGQANDVAIVDYH
ncbi:MAG: type II toxin-antitoxin system RelE/ParE family toxin [Myxococcaceae bacterium]|nr:type II toxin-antitoxin system RelE/ParE family toxin [Myxococcaceae bacterium]